MSKNDFLKTFAFLSFNLFPLDVIPLTFMSVYGSGWMG